MVEGNDEDIQREKDKILYTNKLYRVLQNVRNMMTARGYFPTEYMRIQYDAAKAMSYDEFLKSQEKVNYTARAFCGEFVKSDKYKSYTRIKDRCYVYIGDLPKTTGTFAGDDQKEFIKVSNIAKRGAENVHYIIVSALNYYNPKFAETAKLIPGYNVQEVVERFVFSFFVSNPKETRFSDKIVPILREDAVEYWKRNAVFGGDVKTIMMRCPKMSTKDKTSIYYNLGEGDYITVESRFREDGYSNNMLDIRCISDKIRRSDSENPYKEQ